MLIEGDVLPPFIHAACHLDEELASDCRRLGRHSCLHTTLGICTSIVDMFYSHITVNTDFAWRLIYTEIKRLRKKFPTVDSEGKLVIVQSLTIFVILQAVDTQSAEKNDVAYLLNTALEFVIALANLPEYSKEPYMSRPRRKDFIIRESIHRLISVYGIIDLLLEGLQDPAARTCEPGRSLDESVLPCHRDIWEARTTTAWLRHFDAFLSNRINSTVLLVKHLVDTPDAACTKVSQTQRIGQRLLPDIIQWSEKLDALGSLVYMVIPLHQHRLSNAAWETIQE
ncbi:hypothetical protein HJFPF1_08743 [Paramyrothecium foliicola]|nr:hypothetical protein HJFPF1_08743 [Paramyrothecium foliicola]